MQKRMTKYYFENDFIEFLSYIKTFSVRKRCFIAGTMISSQADTLNKVYYIVSGVMKLSIGINPDDSEKTLALFGPGSMFPLGINEHHYDLEYAIAETAETDVVAYEFDFLELCKMFKDNKDLAIHMMEHYCDFTSFLFYQIAILAANDSLTNVIMILEALAQTPLCQNKKILLSQSDIASLAGASKIQIIRAYKYLKENGVIRVERNCIILNDITKLRKLSRIASGDNESLFAL